MNDDIFYKKKSRIFSVMGTVTVVLMVCVYLFLWFVFERPYVPEKGVPIDTYVDIPNGAGASKVGQILESQGVIRSAQVFSLSVQASGHARDIKSGTYYFSDPESLERVIERVTNNLYNLPTKSIVLYEGEANFSYAKRLAQQLEFFDEEEFIRLTKDKEGFLFPDTYHIPVKATTKEVIKQLEENFSQRIKPLDELIQESPYTLHEIITMASLVETEAGSASYADKQKVAGVLWKRYKKGMLLQADAVFSYIFKQHLPRVLYRHLEVESPYNVYKYTGLPPGPIANPGLDAIRATLTPITTNNIYYLTGNDGTFHYATTLSAHEYNRRLYIAN